MYILPGVRPYFFKSKGPLISYFPTEIKYLIYSVCHSRHKVRLEIVYVNTVLKGQDTIVVCIVITSSCCFINQLSCCQGDSSKL